jgi:hypothetical protein
LYPTADDRLLILFLRFQANILPITMDTFAIRLIGLSGVFDDRVLHLAGLVLPMLPVQIA